MDSNYNSQRKSTENLFDIAAIIDDMWKAFKRIWIILCAIGIICVCATVLFMKLTYNPHYIASATFVVNTYTASTNNANSYNEQTAKQMASTFPYILTSGVLSHLIANDLGTDEINGKMSVDVMEGTNLLTLSVKSPNAQSAYDILQSAMKNYPKISDQVVGETTLELLDETGVPKTPANFFSIRQSIKYGVIIGAVVDILIIFLYAILRSTIKDEDDFKKFLNIKCLGSIPMARFKKRSGKIKNLITIDNSRIPYYYKESLRSIRTRLIRSLEENEMHTFIVTSSMPSEGKTTVAVNLALSLAAKGESVLLVDGDLRNPSVAKALGIEGYDGRGFAGIARLPEIMQEAVIQYKDTSLKVLPGGKPVKNPARLLSGIKQNELIKEMESIADYVIIDTAPSALVSDASILASIVDGTIFVVKQDYIQKDKVIEGVNMVAEANQNFIGCILNQTQPGLTRRGYDYGYGYGYGYNAKAYGETKK